MVSTFVIGFLTLAVVVVSKSDASEPHATNLPLNCVSGTLVPTPGVYHLLSL